MHVDLHFYSCVISYYYEYSIIYLAFLSLVDIQVSVSNYLQSVAMTILVQTSKRVSLKILHLGSSWLEGNVYLEF